MIQVPAFRRNCKATFIHRDQAVLSSEKQQLVIEGPHCGSVAARIDGRSSIQQIIADLSAEENPLEILHALVQLEQKDLVMEAASDLPACEAAFWLRLDVAPRDAARKLRTARFELVSLADGGNEFAAALSQLGPAQATGAPFVAVFVDDYLDSRLPALNREFRSRGASWLLVKAGVPSLVGPLFHSESACWECLAARFHKRAESDASLPATRAWVANLAAAEVAKWIVTAQSGLDGAIALVDPIELRLDMHPVMRRLQCPECGNGFRLDPSQMTQDFSAEESHLSKQLSSVNGVVHSIKIRGAANDLFPVAFASQHFPRAGTEAVAVGTGVTEEDARRSCLAEAVERYSAAFDGTETTLRCCADELDAPHLNVHDLLGIEHAEGILDWTPVWSLTRNQKIWIPAACCFLAYPNGLADSNGCAAGSTFADAIVRGFCELVERDSLALWWYNRLEHPGIPLDPADGPVAAGLRGHLTKLGRTLDVLDLTTDLEMPAVAAISARADGTAVVFGFGAHFKIEIAIRHALLELQQVLGAADAMVDGGFLDPSRPLDRWLGSINVHGQPWLRPAAGNPRVATALEASVESCLEITTRHRMELLVANLTRPDVCVPVARVMVPGLRSAQPRFGPGRLYDVPLALGWLARKRDPSELNPFPFFL